MKENRIHTTVQSRRGIDAALIIQAVLGIAEQRPRAEPTVGSRAADSDRRADQEST